MAKLLTIIEKTEEVRRLMKHDNKSLEEALEIVKGYKESDQTIPSNHNKNNQEQYTTRERFRQTIKNL